MQGMAADAATAAGSGPLLMVRCWPAASITPTCARRQMFQGGAIAGSRLCSLAAGAHTKVAKLHRWRFTAAAAAISILGL